MTAQARWSRSTAWTAWRCERSSRALPIRPGIVPREVPLPAIVAATIHRILPWALLGARPRSARRAAGTAAAVAPPALRSSMPAPRQPSMPAPRPRTATGVRWAPVLVTTLLPALSALLPATEATHPPLQPRAPLPTARPPANSILAPGAVLRVLQVALRRRWAPGVLPALRSVPDSPTSASSSRAVIRSIPWSTRPSAPTETSSYCYENWRRALEVFVSSSPRWRWRS
mmetsp:Transcript_19989/g.48018  ORF Transcript_19989/g.48018 Transcript_19989/m.48018 type:complete len:229 (+) Transcript_19989:1173-1859(+)